MIQLIHVVVTDTESPPSISQWESGEHHPDSPTAEKRAEELASGYMAGDVLAWVWVGHNGPYCPGVWKWFLRIGPPGWPDPEQDRRDQLVHDWRAKQDAAALAAKVQKSEYAKARKRLLPFHRTETTDVLDAIG